MRYKVRLSDGKGHVSCGKPLYPRIAGIELNIGNSEVVELCDTLHGHMLVLVDKHGLCSFGVGLQKVHSCSGKGHIHTDRLQFSVNELPEFAVAAKIIAGYRADVQVRFWHAADIVILCGGDKDLREVLEQLPENISVKLRHRSPMRNDTNCFPHILISWCIFCVSQPADGKPILFCKLRM